jgi:toxic protein SymE
MRICNKYFNRKYGPGVMFPDIRLCGKWLFETGFKAGQYIEVKCEENRIVITHLEEGG